MISIEVPQKLDKAKESRLVERSDIVLNRLVLRLPRLSDAAAMYAGWAFDPEVTKFLIWSPHRSVEVTLAYLQFAIDEWERGHEFTWLICARENDAQIGTVTLTKNDFKAGIGFAMSRNYWGQGLMIEAATAIITVAFSDRVIRRIGAVCDFENCASARVLEKLGMSLEGRLKSWLIHPTLGPNPRDCFSYSLAR